MKQVLGYVLGFSIFIVGIPALMWWVAGMPTIADLPVCRLYLAVLIAIAGLALSMTSQDDNVYRLEGRCPICGAEHSLVRLYFRAPQCASLRDLHGYLYICDHCKNQIYLLQTTSDGRFQIIHHLPDHVEVFLPFSDACDEFAVHNALIY